MTREQLETRLGELRERLQASIECTAELRGMVAECQFHLDEAEREELRDELLAAGIIDVPERPVLRLVEGDGAEILDEMDLPGRSGA